MFFVKVRYVHTASLLWISIQIHIKKLFHSTSHTFEIHDTEKKEVTSLLWRGIHTDSESNSRNGAYTRPETLQNPQLQLYTEGVLDALFQVVLVLFFFFRIHLLYHFLYGLKQRQGIENPCNSWYHLKWMYFLEYNFFKGFIALKSVHWIISKYISKVFRVSALKIFSVEKQPYEQILRLGSHGGLSMRNRCKFPQNLHLWLN